MDAAKIVKYDHVNGPPEIPWKEIHQVRDRGMLSGSNLCAVFNYHKILHSELAGKAVIDVGVGLGIMARQLWGLGATRVIGVDVVPEALGQLEYRAESYLVKDLPVVPPADCAICHLVMQHCNDELMAETLKGIHGSLKPGGWLSVQFAGATGVVPGDRGDVVWRSKGECLKFSEDAGFKILSSNLQWTHGPVEWYVFRCQR